MPKQSSNKKAKKTKAYFDELSEGIRLSNPKKQFCVNVFLPIMDILACQVINRFEGMKPVVTSYQVLEPSFLSNAFHLDLGFEARIFSNKLSDNVSPLSPGQMLSVKTSFRKKIVNLKPVKEMASFLILEYASLTTTCPDVCTAYMMYNDSTCSSC